MSRSRLVSVGAASNAGWLTESAGHQKEACFNTRLNLKGTIADFVHFNCGHCRVDAEGAMLLFASPLLPIA
jgi:hypothetical protein